MELTERLREIMRQEFGITSDRQLMEAVEDMGGLDIGIFTIPLKGEANAQTA
jgi:hypothetical protein